MSSYEVLKWGVPYQMRWGVKCRGYSLHLRYSSELQSIGPSRDIENLEKKQDLCGCLSSLPTPTEKRRKNWLVKEDTYYSTQTRSIPFLSLPPSYPLPISL